MPIPPPPAYHAPGPPAHAPAAPPRTRSSSADAARTPQWSALGWIEVLRPAKLASA
jgi:hypothetical protein